MEENFSILIYKTGPSGILSLRITSDWIEYKKVIRTRKKDGAGFDEEEQAPKMLTDDVLIYRIYKELYLPRKKALDADYKALNTADPRELGHTKSSSRTKINIVDGDFTCDFDLACQKYADTAKELTRDILQLVQEKI